MSLPNENFSARFLGGTDRDFFTIRGGVLRFDNSPDYEDTSHDNVYHVKLVASDGSNSTVIDVAVVVTNVNEPPVVMGQGTVNYTENTTNSVSVATYTALDPEGDTSIAWSLAGTDRGDFDIDGGVLTFKNTPDYERPADFGSNNHYEVTVEAKDSNNHRGELHVDVIVKNVDEPPTLEGPDTVNDFPENSSTSRQVGRYTATDPEGATITLSLAAGNADFALASNGVVTFKESPDYEEQSSYSVTVKAVAGSRTVDKQVTVNILNMEEPGTVTLSAVQPQEGTLLAATLEDDDNPSGTTWQWYRSSSRGSTGTTITNTSLRFYMPVDDDVGSYLRVVASYDDGHGDDKTATAVSANRVQKAPPDPEAPVFPADRDYDRTIRENTPAGRNVGAPVTAIDDNNDRLTYSIGASDYFEIIDSTGQIRTKGDLDHEAVPTHIVEVTATDPSNTSDSGTVTVVVEDADETPEITGPATVDREEGGGTDAATFTATDPDEKGIEWVLTGTDSEDFDLSGGSLYFKEVPDFEAPEDSNRDNRHHVTIEARELGNGTSTSRLNVTIKVANADEQGTLVPVSNRQRVGYEIGLELKDPDGVSSIQGWRWESSAEQVN